MCKYHSLPWFFLELTQRGRDDCTLSRSQSEFRWFFILLLFREHTVVNGTSLKYLSLNLLQVQVFVLAGFWKVNYSIFFIGGILYMWKWTEQRRRCVLLCCFSVVSPRICTNSVEKKLCVFVLIVNWTKLEPDEICVHGDFCLNKTPAAVTIYDYNRSFVK